MRIKRRAGVKFASASRASVLVPPVPRNYHPRALRVTCWCEADEVFVSPGDVGRGVTASCGRKKCDALHAKATGKEN